MKSICVTRRVKTHHNKKSGKNTVPYIPKSVLGIRYNIFGQRKINLKYHSNILTLLCFCLQKASTQVVAQVVHKSNGPRNHLNQFETRDIQLARKVVYKALDEDSQELCAKCHALLMLADTVTLLQCQAVRGTRCIKHFTGGFLEPGAKSLNQVQL